VDARTTLPADPASAGSARRFVRARLNEWNAWHLEDPALLLVSELVTNAILHARSESMLTVVYDDGVLRVEVADASLVGVQRRVYARDAATGRGLLLVDAIATAWGTVATEEGKAVWFELDSDARDIGAVG
jgi:anti-sigma regulatory factor (Ser/Thr protein kinase)